MRNRILASILLVFVIVAPLLELTRCEHQSYRRDRRHSPHEYLVLVDYSKSGHEIAPNVAMDPDYIPGDYEELPRKTGSAVIRVALLPMMDPVSMGASVYRTWRPADEKELLSFAGQFQQAADRPGICALKTSYLRVKTGKIKYHPVIGNSTGHLALGYWSKGCVFALVVSPQALSLWDSFFRRHWQ